MLCDKKFPNKLKGKFYRVRIRLATLYGTKCWSVKKMFENKMEVRKMSMMRWMCGHTIMDRLRNHEFREKLRVAPLFAKMRENRFRWFEHVKRKTYDGPVRRIESLIVERKRSRGRPIGEHGRNK